MIEIVLSILHGKNGRLTSNLILMKIDIVINLVSISKKITIEWHFLRPLHQYVKCHKYFEKFIDICFF